MYRSYFCGASYKLLVPPVVIRSAWVSLEIFTDLRSAEQRSAYTSGCVLCFIFFYSRTRLTRPAQAVMLGPVLGPLVGGLVAHSYSWRAMQYGLLGYALLSLVLAYLLQPETCQPGTRGFERADVEKRESTSWVWLNPFGSLALLRSPNVLLLVSVLQACP